MQKRLPNGQIVYEQDYSCIVQPQNGRGGIFLGNLEAAQNLKTLKKHGIRAILTAAKGIDLNHPKSEIPFYLQVPGQDRDGFDMTRFFNQSINFIRDSLQNTSIMVHCLAGVSRSVCLVLAYFIKCKGFSYEQAYNLVKIKRSIIHPNEGFISQLKKFEVQIRSSGHHNLFSKFQVSSPTKRKYQYFFDQEQPKNNNVQIYQYQRQSNVQLFSSPIKKQLNNTYSRVYGSPSKANIIQAIRQDYSSPTKNILSSPSKNRALELRQGRQSMDMSTYVNTPAVEFSKIQSFNETNHFDAHVELRHISPERKRYHQVQPRGRSSSNLNMTNDYGRNPESSRLFGNYNKLKQSSTVELSEQLDSKIAAIRQKYAQYSKHQLTGCSRRMSARQSQSRYNNFIDENDSGLSGVVAFKKFTSEYEPNNGKFSGREFGIISNNLGKSSAGLGLRRLNSMRQGY